MGLSVGQPITQETVVQSLMDTYSDGQTSYAAYEKLEQCQQHLKEQVGKYKFQLEELMWTIQDDPSELAKTAKFVSGLLPALNKKLQGKEYDSFQLAFEAAQVEEHRLKETVKKMEDVN